MRQGRYGLRGERVGEASNPGPDREVEGVAPTQEDSDTHGSGVVHFNMNQRDAPTEETCSDTESCRSQDVTSVRLSGRRSLASQTSSAASPRGADVAVSSTPLATIVLHVFVLGC